MGNGVPEFKPRAKDLLVRELRDEFIIYDPSLQTAYCLNAPAAAVWKLCDGDKSVADITHSLNQDSTAATEEELVWLAVDELNKSGLLQNEISPCIQNKMLSRRDLIKKMAISVTVALPIVTSILLPTPADGLSPARPTRARHSPSRRP